LQINIHKKTSPIKTIAVSQIIKGYLPSFTHKYLSPL